jgi:hypothetical protein
VDFRRIVYGVGRGARRGAKWLVVAVVIVVLLLVAIDVFVDEPLRRYTEREVNNRLKGYTLHIAKLNFHVLGFGLDLVDATLVQQANPDPPVADFPKIEASVQWKELMFGRLVANFRVVEPKLHVNRAHLLKEAHDETPVSDKGWQAALEAIYPLKINEFSIVNADVTYVDDARMPPLHLSNLNIVAGNIRNIHSADRDYPSPIHIDSVVFDAGKLSVDGHADFLKEPFMGANANVRIEGVPLAYFTSVLRHYHLNVKKGTLDVAGRIEYAPTVKIVDLSEVNGRQVQIDYVHEAKNASEDTKAAAKATVRAADEASNAPDMLLKIARFDLSDGEFGFVDRSKTPSYRAFIANTNLVLDNLSNQFVEGPAKVKLTGKFMGTGDTNVEGTFRSEKSGPDFDLDVKIENTQLPSMNDMLRAYGKFDVVAGLFAFYSEIRVKDRYVRGYVKPLFSNLDVYDKEQDKEKSALHKVYEKAVGVVSKVLENRPRSEVATKVDISGPLESPSTNTIQVILRLVQNAFIKAILPGFEREVGPRSRHYPSASVREK